MTPYPSSTSISRGEGTFVLGALTAAACGPDADKLVLDPLGLTFFEVSGLMDACHEELMVLPAG